MPISFSSDTDHMQTELRLICRNPTCRKTNLWIMDLEHDISQKLPSGWSHFIPEVEEHLLTWVYRDSLCLNCVEEGRPQGLTELAHQILQSNYYAGCKSCLEFFGNFETPKEEKQAINFLKDVHESITSRILSNVEEAMKKTE